MFTLLVVVFFLICVAGSAAIAILMRDGYIYAQMFKYVSLLQKHGEDSQEEYDFRANASTSISDFCHLVRSSRDDASAKACEAVENQIVANRLASTKAKRAAAKVNDGKTKK